MNSYELSRSWFDWSFENPEKVRPIHTAIYFFAIEHSNRLGWKEKFGFPSQMVMDAIGIKKFQTYGKALHQLSDWGFIEFIEKSKNQYSANIIRLAIPKKGKAQGKALDKAFIKHGAKHSNSTGQGMDSIDKQLNNETLKQENGGNSRALTFLKINYPSRFQTDFQMKYANKILDKKKFTEDFNDTVDQEDLEYTQKKLFSRLGKYARNWIENQEKYKKNNEVGIVKANERL